MEFYVKPKGRAMGGSEAFFICKADFVLDPDGQWLLQTFQVFNPAVDTNRPMTMPELPQ